MGTYAAPNYIDKHLTSFEDIPPGHRFGLFFKCWNRSWGLDETGKKEGLSRSLKVGQETQSMLKALRLRQYEQAQSFAENSLLRIGASSHAPFMTGIGMEHPLENGFAFLNPYGLPYLPGSSIKGVLRRAAEDLALNDPDSGWSLPVLWWLFGFEASSAYLTGKGGRGLQEEGKEMQKLYSARVPAMATDPALPALICALLSGKEGKSYSENPEAFLRDLTTQKNVRDKLALRGALCFWDAYPDCKGLAMDILTPHHGKYYQGNTPPNDCGQPVPNTFLVLPPGSDFPFYVNCHVSGLPNSLQTVWKDLLGKAFAHTFDWFGFGAKTAVGYGQMEQDDTILDLLSEQLLEEEKKSRPWLAAINSMSNITNWGDLKQRVLENESLQAYRHIESFVTAVYQAAVDIRTRGTNWGEDRDAQLVHWFETSSLAWPPDSETEEEVKLNAEEQLQMDLIASLKAWQPDLLEKVDLSSLCRPALLALRAKMENWGCNNRRARKDKLTAWKALQAATRKLPVAQR